MAISQRWDWRTVAASGAPCGDDSEHELGNYEAFSILGSVIEDGLPSTVSPNKSINPIVDHHIDRHTLPAAVPLVGNYPIEGHIISEIPRASTTIPTLDASHPIEGHNVSEIQIQSIGASCSVQAMLLAKSFFCWCFVAGSAATSNPN